MKIIFLRIRKKKKKKKENRQILNSGILNLSQHFLLHPSDAERPELSLLKPGDDARVLVCMCVGQ